nr:zinc knuckle CX2CX4HX4C [Tanacetum cinerariifolium]
MEDLSNLMQDTRSSFFSLDFPEDELIIIMDESKEEETKRYKDNHETFHDEPKDTSGTGAKFSKVTGGGDNHSSLLRDVTSSMKLRSGRTLDLSDALPKHAFRALKEDVNATIGNDNVTNKDQDHVVNAGDDVFSRSTVLVTSNTSNLTLPLDGSPELTVGGSNLLLLLRLRLLPHIAALPMLTSEPSHDSPIVQSVDINTKPTSYVGAAGASAKGQSKVNSNFCPLMADPIFDGVNISIPCKVVEKKQLGETWAKRDYDECQRLFFFKFDTQARVEAVLEGSPWMIRKSMIILKKWSMDTRLLKEELTCILIWVKLHDVSLQVFQEDGISLIATSIDKETQSSSAKNKSLSHPSASTHMVTKIHNEAHQAAGGLTSLRATSEEGSHSQLSS